ncbi:FAD-dependent oxidoreductase [Streptomyces albofaciens JCM 4342]|uniref:FAD-dependent monooxygenase n=1 Tax=Streptomyces albofaciens TaxID=66866 RepID=UPI0012393309|nr:FAD-dependent monooxygenase [Streptomyces albofaciens]KAA6221042.1 FAD-dependent oxidoreductase [Streptomyces albofaciens JCM 4342]
MRHRTPGTTDDLTPVPADRTADVIVVGAGPTGLLLAGDLAVAGLRVTLLERRAPGISNLTRALAVHARSLEQLDARGLADELVAGGHALPRVQLFSGAVLEPARLPTRFPFVLITPQYEVERLLERRAQKAGVTFRYGARVTGLDQDADGVDVHVQEEGGATTYRAAYLVGTDGVHSTVREALGLPFPGRSVVRSVVLADVRLDQQPAVPLVANANGDAFALIGDFGDGWYRVIGWDRHRQIPEDTPVEEDEIRAYMRLALGSDYGMHDVRWTSRFHSDERQVPRYRVGRAFVAGDAAHVHSPAGGQGMNTGLQDAANLSWKLAAVLRGDAPDSLLDSYHTERHPVGRTVLRSSGALVRSAQLRTPPLRALRAVSAQVLNHVPPLADRVLAMISGIGISYAAGRGAHPLAGKRAPDLRLAGGTRLHEALRDGAFVLVTPEGEKVPGDVGETVPTGRTDAAGAPADGSAPGPRLVRAAWDSDRRTALLVRPDGYIAWATDAADPEVRAESLRGALVRWTGAGRAAARTAARP